MEKCKKESLISRIDMTWFRAWERNQREKVMRTFWQQLSESFLKKNILAGYILGLSVVLKNAINYSGFVGDHTVNAVEPFIISFSNKGDAMILMMGCLIALSDAPFITAASFSVIHRSGRKCWYHAMWIYMEVQCMLYYISLLLVSLLPFAFKGYAQNAWSQTLLRVAKGSADIMKSRSLVPPCENVAALPPYTALFHTLMWAALYSLCLSSVLFVFNMKLNKNAVGTIAAGCLHILSIMMCFEWIPGMDMSKWSLFHNSVFPVYYAPESVSVVFTYCYFIMVLYLVYMIGEHFLPFVSFVMNEKEA